VPFPHDQNYITVMEREINMYFLAPQDGLQSDKVYLKRCTVGETAECLYQPGRGLYEITYLLECPQPCLRGLETGRRGHECRVSQEKPAPPFSQQQVLGKVLL